MNTPNQTWKEAPKCSEITAKTLISIASFKLEFLDKQIQDLEKERDEINKSMSELAKILCPK